ncbi:MAG: ComEC/Rec2 family competence protein, partial [Lewinella sp.]|nr:ComEC/Rec2 family competence protein [Lewinella sp.]
THLRLPANHPGFLGNYSPQTTYWDLTIRETKVKEKSIQVTAITERMLDSVQIRNTVGGLLLYLQPTDSLAQKLAPGDRILVRASVHPIEGPKNPQVFHFARYMAGKGVYHRAYAGPDDWIKTGHLHAPLSDLFHRIRSNCLAILADYLPGKQELAIGAALITGQRHVMDEEVRQAYTATGAVHVLAVSGLHIGMIYLGISWLLGLLGWKEHPKRWLRSIILLLSVWGFALFTGGSASVLRAATMFSFIILGEALHRKQNIYNSIAASAFVLLCLEPLLLRDVGFQLSYLAVIGIVFFQGRIYRALYVRHRLGNYLWKLTAVSIAAQLTTLPISLYYFHQFPFYFWLSGWIVVPGAMLILAVGLLLLVLAKVPFIGGILGWLLFHLIEWMNNSIFQIGRLPGGLLEGIWLGTEAVLLLYTTLICLMAGLAKKNLHWIKIGLCALLFVAALNDLDLQKSVRQKTICIYHVPGHTVIDFFEGRTTYCFSDLPEIAPTMMYPTTNFREYSRIKQVRHINTGDMLMQAPHLLAYGNSIRFLNKSIAILNNAPLTVPTQPTRTDYLIISGKPGLSFAQLDRYYHFKTIVFDASNRRSLVTKWKKVCKEKGWDYYDINEEGAMILQLE